MGHQLGFFSGNPIPLVAWDPLMKAHQHHTAHSYPVYRDLYNTPVRGIVFDNLKREADAMYLQGTIFGSQMSAFYTAFYGVVDFLDKLLMVQQPMYDSYAIPLEYHVSRTQKIYQMQERYWFEHVTMFEDYNKACAMENHVEMYKIRVTMLESCANIALSLGEVFRAFDHLIRSRDLYERLDAPPM